MSTDQAGSPREHCIVRAVIRRLLSALLVVWATATIVFFALRAAGDPIEAIMGGPGSQASVEATAQARAEYGLDRSIFVQYVTQLWRIATLDFGDSYSRKQPVIDLLSAHVPPTLLLASLSFVLAWALALVSVVIAVNARGRFGGMIRALLTAIETIASVTPQFFLGALLIMGFAMTWKVLPATGTGPGGLILPTVTLAVPIAGYLAHVLYGPLAEATHAPYAMTARARGASETRVLFSHTLRHAALPAIALSGWAYGSLLSGAVVVEVLFARPGLGRLLQEAATVRDVPVVIGGVVVIALFYVAVMVLADVAEWLVRPKEVRA